MPDRFDPTWKLHRIRRRCPGPTGCYGQLPPGVAPRGRTAVRKTQRLVGL